MTGVRRAWAGRLGAAVALPLALLGGSAAHAQSGLVHALKATFIYKLAAFVQWPPNAFASPSAPLTLCVVGSDPFGEVLDKAVAGQHIDSHPIAVRRLGGVEHAAGCRILYVGMTNAASAGQVLRSVRGGPVLTITDSAFEDGAKGVVHFVIRDGRIRFEIDEAAAAQNGLVLSSKLKALAVPAHG